MLLLHVSDLHVGRQFNGISLDEDHEVIFEQIFAVIVEHRPQVLIIAGDIFDRASPPASAVRIFNAFLTRVANETKAAVVMIAGNHDSADRITAMSVLTDAKRALIAGTLAGNRGALCVSDDHGVVAFTALPFCQDLAAREFYGDEAIATPQDVLKAQVAEVRQYVPQGARWVAVAHGYVAGATLSDTERSLTRVGGIETVSADVFEGVHYVALGHLHRAQHVGRSHVRYSGAPLAFSFAEAGDTKSMQLVSMDASGSVMVESLPYVPRRKVRVLRGKLAELELAEPSEDFVMAVLSDEGQLIDPMKRLRAVFPNACQLTYARDLGERHFSTLSAGTRATQPIEVVDAFLRQVRGEPLAASERDFVGLTLERIQTEGDAE